MKLLKEKLKRHVGHDLTCVWYGDINAPRDICIECLDCNEVLVSCETIENGFMVNNIRKVADDKPTNIEGYFHVNFYPVATLIQSLYEMKGCNCGGLCHIVVDKDNIYDDCLDSVLELCELEENKDREDTEICSAICKMMKRMSFYQRATLFFMMINAPITNYSDCEPNSVFRHMFEDKIPECYKMFDYRHEFHEEDDNHPEKE